MYNTASFYLRNFNILQQGDFKNRSRKYVFIEVQVVIQKLVNAIINGMIYYSLFVKKKNPCSCIALQQDMQGSLKPEVIAKMYVSDLVPGISSKAIEVFVSYNHLCMEGAIKGDHSDTAF